LRRLNDGSFSDPRVHVVNDDAFRWLEASKERFDFAIVDFPDPSNFSLGKLYTTTFYRMLVNSLAPDATFVVQATSPLFAGRSFGAFGSPIGQVGLGAVPYPVSVPWSGGWGFVLAGRAAPRRPPALPANLRFLNLSALNEMFDFPSDMARVP